MRATNAGHVLTSLTIVAASLAGTLAFLALYRLRDDPIPALGSAYRTAAFLQPIPYVLAIVVAIGLRRRPAVVAFLLAGVVGCGAYGAWWLSGLAEIRRVENEPVRRNALGNIFPDIEGEAGAVEAWVWPLVVAVIVGGLTFVGWLAVGRGAGRPVTRTSPSEAR
jgi:phosphotransferase system  glucose/maltose/N-acetylglucosamine-specific IIC component